MEEHVAQDLVNHQLVAYAYKVACAYKVTYAYKVACAYSYLR